MTITTKKKSIKKKGTVKKRSREALVLPMMALALVMGLGCSKKIDDHGDTKVVFSDAKRVLSSVFFAAQSGQSEHLASLCDPEGEANVHAKRICSQQEHLPDWPNFVRQFEKGKLIGEARISGNRALINFVFGENGTEAETMELVRRQGQWYLMSF